MSDQTDSGSLTLPVQSSSPPLPITPTPGPECCLNCLQPTSQDKESISQFQLGDSVVQIHEVLCFIFNITLSSAVPKETLRNLSLCSTCASIIKQTYQCHQELMRLTHLDSWLHFILEQQQQQAKPIFPPGTTNMSPKEEQSAIHPQSSSSPPSHNIVNMLPVQVIPSTKMNGTLVAPIKNKKIKHALISTDPGTESILILETNEPTHSGTSSTVSTSNPPKRRMLVPTEFYDLSRAHSCTTCGESFLQKSSLDFHIHWIHNGKTKYLCNLCLQPLGSELILEQHMTTHHPEIPNPIEHIKIIQNSSESSGSGRSKRSNRKSSTPQKIENPLLPLPLQPISDIPASKTRQFVCSNCSNIFPTVTLRNGHERTCKLVSPVPEADQDQHQPIDYGKKTRITVINSAPPTQTPKNPDVEEVECPYSTNCIVLVPNAPSTSLTTKRKLLLKHIKTVHPDQKVRLEVLDDYILRSELARRQAEICAGGIAIPAPPPAKRTNHRTTSAGPPPSATPTGFPSRVIIRSTSSATNSSPTGAVTALPIPTFSGSCTCGSALVRVSRSKVEEHFKSVHGRGVRFLCPFCSMCLGTNGKNSFRKHLISHYAEEGRSSEEDRVLRTECGLILPRDNLE